jgi:hypothetical protein
MRNWINLKVVIGGIFFALCIFGALVAILWFAKPKTYSQAPATAILSIIQAPTETPIPQITLTPTSEPSSSQGVPLPSGPIAIGDYVQVSGTGGDGLRLHATAGVSSEVRYVAIEAEVFLVQEGPNESDGYTWWLLQDPYNEIVVGWGVSNYLSVVQNPE